MTPNPPTVRIPSLPEVYRSIEIPKGGAGWKRYGKLYVFHLMGMPMKRSGWDATRAQSSRPA